MSALSEKTPSQSSLVMDAEESEKKPAAGCSSDAPDGIENMEKEAEAEAEPMGSCDAAEGGEPAEADGTAEVNTEEESANMIAFKLAFGRKVFDISAPANQKVEEFQKTVYTLTNVMPIMQKLLWKGSKLQPDMTLESAHVTAGAKILLVGSTMEQVVSANTKPSADDIKKAEAAASSSREPLSKQKMHAKIVDQGPPDDVMPGIKNVKEVLPPAPLRGMKNKHGRAVRLTFKLELDQLWIGTPERTDKIPMGQISDIVSEPIHGREEYSIVGIGVGSTEASRVWIYWVPSQYVDAIRKAVL